MGKITISTLDRMKAAAEKIAVITSYDASFTQQIEKAGMDVILVGDSLGMVIQGHESTLPVTVGDIVYHTANVMRVSEHCLLIADMPFMSHGTPEQALDTAGRLMKEGGAHMVKIEGGAPQLETVRHLTARAVPVCGHLGLMPQSIHQLGAYRVQGRGEHEGERILKDAVGLQKAGAQMLVLECVPALLAEEMELAWISRSSGSVPGWMSMGRSWYCTTCSASPCTGRRVSCAISSPRRVRWPLRSVPMCVPSGQRHFRPRSTLSRDYRQCSR